MAPDDDTQAGVPPSSLYAGSGDIQLEATITKLRASMMRAITELDLFCVAVREARERVIAVKDALEEEHTSG